MSRSRVASLLLVTLVAGCGEQRLTPTAPENGSIGQLPQTISTATIANVAPTVAPFSGATILLGETYARGGSFTDADNDSWTATVDWGDGSDPQPLTLYGTTFGLNHTYLTSGALTVTVTVNDGDGGIGTQSTTVTVRSPSEAVAWLSGEVERLGDIGTLSMGESNALRATLGPAIRQLDRGNTTPALNQIGAFDNKLEALVRSRRLDAGHAAVLMDYTARVRACIAIASGGLMMR